MYDFDIQFHNTRMRGIYECPENIHRDSLESAIAYYAEELMATGITLGELCTVGKLLSYKIRLNSNFDNADIHIRINDVTKSVPQPQKSVFHDKTDSISDTSCWVCKCGKQNDYNFCSFCGTKRESFDEYCCGKCGHKVHKGDNYCVKCGNKLI